MSVLDRVVTTILYSNAKLNWETGTFDTSCLCNNYYYFELIEDETIDIDSIEELDEFELDQFIIMDNAERFDRTMIEYSKINKLVQAVKQLNKEIKSIKEK